LDEDGTTALLVAATTSVADAENGDAPVAEAVAVKAMLAASGAEADTGTEISSSKTRPTGRVAMLHVAPVGDGQMAKLGVLR
jgi:hypothetical protein